MTSLDQMPSLVHRARSWSRPGILSSGTLPRTPLAPSASSSEMTASILSGVRWNRFTSTLAGTASAMAMSPFGSRAAALPLTQMTGFSASSSIAAAARSASSAGPMVLSPIR